MRGTDAVDERQRRRAVRRYLAAAAAIDLDDVARIATHLLDVTVAAVSLVDATTVRVIAAVGTEAMDLDRPMSFSDVVVSAGEVVCVPDAVSDADHDHLRAVQPATGLRMLAGAPLHDPTGAIVGALVVADPRPAALTDDQRAVLRALAELAGSRLEAQACGNAQRRADEALRQAVHRFDRLVEDVQDVVVVLDPDGTATSVSDALGRLLGYEEVNGGFDIFTHVHPDDVALARAALHVTAATPGRSGPAEFRALTSAGDHRWLEAMANNLLDDPAVGGIVVTFRDVTHRRRTEALLSAEAHVIHLVVSEAPVEEVLAFIAGVLEEHAGPARYSIRLVDEATGELRLVTAPSLADSYLDAIAGCTIDSIVQPLAEAARAREPVVVEDLLALPGLDAEFARVAEANDLRSAWAAPIISPRTEQVLGTITGYGSKAQTATPSQLLLVQMAADVAAIALERRAGGQVHTDVDNLTGLLDRTGLLTRLEEAVVRCQRTGNRVGVLMLDLDRFKVVNDRLGHDAGDDVLRAVGRRLAEVIRPTDIVGRFGADEFVVVCEGVIGEVECVGVAERLGAALAEPFGDDVVLSASIGIAVSPHGPAEASFLLRDADTAMYRAKERGPARCEVFTEATRRRALQRAETERELRRAIERDELRVWYQPAVELRTGRVTGYEALVRWEHPQKGLVAPAEFIPVAELTGLIVPIGEIVLRAACEQAARWRNVEGDDVTVAVNLSARQLAEPRLVHMVRRILDETGVDGTCLCLEITESVLMEDADSAVETLCALKRLGVTIAIDDFGTGYSSLAYLSTLPVDVLKVDRSFVAGLDRRGSHGTIVGAVIGMAHALGLRTVAEGVESREQLDELVRLDCEAAQGFLFGRPEPVTD